MEASEDHKFWTSVRKLAPSEEQLNRLDRVSEQFSAQHLRILDEAPSRSRSRKLTDWLSADHPYNLSVDFGNAVYAYVNLKDVFHKRLEEYKRHPTHDTRHNALQGLFAFHDAANNLDKLYYRANGEHRLDQEIGKELEELRAAKAKLKADVDDLTAKLATCEQKLNGLRKRLPDTSEFGDVSSD